MRLGIADHLGWAVAVTASADHRVVDRRRIELIEPGRATSAALDAIATALPAPIVSISLRAWPATFPDDLAVQRRAPYEARADAIMYRRVLAEFAHARGWDVDLYDARNVVDRAVIVLGERADEVLWGPRATLGPPWAKDHRVALAAAILAG